MIIPIGCVEHGSGVTTIALALANYLHSKSGKRVAYIELNPSNEICSLAKNEKVDLFSFYGIHFYPHRAFTSLPEILHQNYDCFILDMGVLNTYTAREFARWNPCFLVCSLNKWKKKKTLEKVTALCSSAYLPIQQIIILSNCCKKESTWKLSSRQSLFVLPIPFLSNPFQLSPEFFSSFEKILGQY